MGSFDLQNPRLRGRRSIALAGLGLSAAYWLFGELSGWAALLGIVAIATWALAWPEGEPARSLQGLQDKGSMQEKLDAAEQPAAAPGSSQPKADQNAAPGWGPLMEGIPDPAVLLSPASTAIAANLAAREQLAIRPGMHVSFAVRSPDLLAAIEEARRTQMPQTAEVHFAVPIERALTVHVTPVAYGGSAGGGSALMLVFRDHTEEQQIAQLRADFVANASHELRTPLASVKGFIETLQGAARNDPAARERFLGIMHVEASRMSRLIDDLLSLSRVEMREHLAPRDRVDLAGIADDITRALEPVAREAGRRLEVVVDSRPAIVRGDRDELVQVLQNLVQNALKYGRDGGLATVRIVHDAGRIELSVADDGIGIAPEHLPRLTERFYRVNAKDSRERGGTGLGLAIVKHIVNRHRGELRIASTIGKGSTFTVSLPRPEIGS